MLGDDIAAALPDFRQQAESLMRETCRVGVWRRSADTDPQTGEYVYTLEPVVYEGPCRFKPGATQANQIDAAGQTLVEQLAVMSFPVTGTAGITTDHVVEVLTSQTDPALAGQRFRVSAPFFAALASARRFTVEGVS